MEKSANWRTQSRPAYSHDLKLRIVELASQPDANIAQIARENGVAYNLIFRWLRLWQKEGRVSRRLPATITPSSSPALLPVEVIPEPALPCMPLLRCHIAYTTVTVLSLYHRINFSTQTRASSRVLNPDDGHCGTYSASGTVTQRTHYHCSPRPAMRRRYLQLCQLYLQRLRLHRRAIVRVQHQWMTAYQASHLSTLYSQFVN